jgi:hypothetical protein
LVKVSFFTTESQRHRGSTEKNQTDFKWVFSTSF